MADGRASCSGRRTVAAARLLALATSLCGGCGLVAPFDLGALPPGTDGDVDGDQDGDSAADADGNDEDAEADAEADADGSSWDPLAGCVGGETEERWLVVAAAGGVTRSYVTGRDCAEPELLCEGCVAMAISPSGTLAAAIQPTLSAARVYDEILVIDLESPGHGVAHPGLVGALPAWVDDDALLYVATPASWGGACWESPPPLRPEVVDLRRFDLASGRDVLVGSGLGRGWETCCPVVSADRLWVALGEDLSSSCDAPADVVTVVSLETGTAQTLAWTRRPPWGAVTAPLGLLPDGTGFVVQKDRATDPPVSTLFATSFEGAVTDVAGPLRAGREVTLPGPVASGTWGDCATVRRLGPACEVYCLDPYLRQWSRLHLVDGSRDPVDCSEIIGDVRIMDVRQVAAEPTGTRRRPSQGRSPRR